MIPGIGFPSLIPVTCKQCCNHSQCTLVQCVGDELRAIVPPQMGVWWVTPDQLLDHVDHLCSLAAPTDLNGQAVAAVVVDHVQELKGPPIYGLVELEVVRSIMMGYSTGNSSRIPPEACDHLRRRGRCCCSPSYRQIRCPCR